MPTILSHPAIPLSLALALGSRRISNRLLGAGIVASVLADVDVIGLRFGVPYLHDLGHRGFTHSLAFCAAVAFLAFLAAPGLRAPRSAAFLFILVAGASHGALDMLTNGGHGIAYFWPLSSERYFFPVRPIEVSPLSLHRFFGQSGAAVLLSELRWIWLPATAVAVASCVMRRRIAA